MKHGKSEEKSEYALFLGCYIPTRVPSMEKSYRMVLDALGIRLVDMNGASCCPDPMVVKGIDYKSWLVLAARNLCLAEEMGLDILTFCNGCFETLKSANTMLKENRELREDVNGVLGKVGREFKGKIEVRHAVEVLNERKEELKGLVEKPLTDIAVAVHYGCHLLRPSTILNVDNPLNPTILDRIVEEVVGAKSVNYRRKMWCCGAGARMGDPELSLRVLREKLVGISKSGADCIALVCPFCHVQFDTGQILIRREFKEDYRIPVLSLPQLVGLAMNLEPKQLAFDLHKVSVAPLLEKIGGVA